MTRNDRGRATGVAVSHEALRRSNPVFALAICALCFSALPALSRAAGSDEAGARVLFAEGRKLAAAGNYVEACPKFEDSFRLDPGIGTNFNWADCLEHIGRTASAWARFVEVAAATKAAGQVERERVARARAVALEPKLARLVVVVRSPVPGLLVARDGVALAPASWGSSVPVDPGDHLVEATAPGKRTWSQNTAVPDAPTTVSVSVPALEPLPPSQPRLAAPMGATSASQLSLVPRAERARRASIPVVAFGALGAVALATGALLALKVVAENGDAKGLCSNNNTCGSLDEKMRHDTLVSDAHSDRNLAFISAGIGGAALLAAGYLWWRPAHSEPTKDPAAGLSVRPLAGALGAHLEIDW